MFVSIVPVMEARLFFGKLGQEMTLFLRQSSVLGMCPCVAPIEQLCLTRDNSIT